MTTNPLRMLMRLAPAEPHQVFVVSSLALGTGLGILLGLLVALSRLFGWRVEDDAPDLAQVHGEVQVIGFVGLFIIGMALRLMPRFAHTTLAFSQLIAPIWSLIVAALLGRALVVIWLPDELHSLSVLLVELAFLTAAGCFATIVWITLLPSQARSEATAWFFLSGSLLFLLQAILGSAIALRELKDDTHVFSYLPHAARLYLLLGGFVIAFIAGVSSRALPVMVGRRRSDRLGRLVAVALSVDVVVLAGALAYLEYGTYSLGIVSVADIALTGLGFLFAVVVWLSGVFRPRANRLRPASQPHLWLVRSAFAWLVFAALLAVYAGLHGLAVGELPSFNAVDGLRHTLGLGLATTLITGMGLLILPEFAAERQDRPDQARRSYLLLVALNMAALLRVGSSLAAPVLDPDLRLALQADSGFLAEFALIVFAWTFVGMIRSDNA